MSFCLIWLHVYVQIAIKLYLLLAFSQNILSPIVSSVTALDVPAKTIFFHVFHGVVGFGLPRE